MFAFLAAGSNEAIYSSKANSVIVFPFLFRIQSPVAVVLLTATTGAARSVIKFFIPVMRENNLERSRITRRSIPLKSTVIGINEFSISLVFFVVVVVSGALSPHHSALFFLLMVTKFYARKRCLAPL